MSLALGSFINAGAISQGGNASLGMQNGWNRMAAFSGNPQAAATDELALNNAKQDLTVANLRQDNANSLEKSDAQRTFGYA